MRAAKLIALAALAGALLVSAGASAQRLEGGRLVLGEEDVWTFAESLLSAGEYYRAITEYKRLLHFFPQGARAPLAARRLAEAYLLGGELPEAERQANA